jgi:elongation factor 1 alpha-like protein
MDSGILVTEKDTKMDPTASAELDELVESSSSVPSSSQNVTLALGHELQHLSLESKPKGSKPKIKKPASVSQYKPEPWMLQSEDQEMRRQLNLAIVSNNCLFAFQPFIY